MCGSLRWVGEWRGGGTCQELTTGGEECWPTLKEKGGRLFVGWCLMKTHQRLGTVGSLGLFIHCAKKGGWGVNKTSIFFWC